MNTVEHVLQSTNLEIIPSDRQEALDQLDHFLKLGKVDSQLIGFSHRVNQLAQNTSSPPKAVLDIIQSAVKDIANSALTPLSPPRQTAVKNGATCGFTHPATLAN